MTNNMTTNGTAENSGQPFFTKYTPPSATNQNGDTHNIALNPYLIGM